MPDQNAICRRIVLSWPGSCSIQQAAVGQVSTDARLTFTGWFGYPNEVNEMFGVTTIWDDLPSSIAAREQRTFVSATRTQFTERFPHLADHMPTLSSIIATPIVANTTTIGVCVVSSDQPLRDPDAAVGIMIESAAALSLYLNGGRFNDTNHTGPQPIVTQAQPVESTAKPIATSPTRNVLVPNQLTERQLATLVHLCEGSTNRQIAARLGFSESTIRQETMAIYAFFGVHSRAAAVEQAIMRGIVTIHDDNGDSATVNQ